MTEPKKAGTNERRECQRTSRSRKPNGFPVDSPVQVEGEIDLETASAKASLALKKSSGLDNIVSEEMLIECAIPPLMIDMVDNLYIKDDMPIMVDKYETPLHKTCPVDIEVFRSTYVPKLDESAEKLKKQKFSCEKEAQLVLCQMIRSFVPNLAAHVERNRKGKTTHWISFCCSTVNHSVKREEGDCTWKAKLVKQKDGFFQFTEINSFGKHCEKCIKNRARFTPAEVDFLELFPDPSRPHVAKILKQIPVDDMTMAKRKQRRVSLLTDVDRKILTDFIKDVEIDTNVSSLPVEQIGTKEEPNEAYRLLQLLTFYQQKDRACAKAFFERGGKERLSLCMLTFIWPEGLSLLKSHSDAIYCDSMWNINEDGDHILTIVTVNREEKLRLAASAIAFRENRNSWETFFRWVKECVKEFDPKCLVTDGADYIHTAFTKAINPKIWHASCWWHRNRAVSRMFGQIGAVAKNLQTMVYADSVEKLKQEEAKVEKMLEKIKADGLKPGFEKNEFDRVYNELKTISDHTFVSMPVFSGGTLSNSYAESINSCLRKVGLTAFSSRLDSIYALRNYCNSSKFSIKKYSKKREELLEKYMKPEVIRHVSNGVLRHQAKQIEQAQAKCTMVKQDNSSYTVRETFEKQLKTGCLIRRVSERVVTWEEETEQVKCSCNSLVYRGMPCIHTAFVAKEKNFQIPLSCFNKRYHYPHPVSGPSEPAQDESSFLPSLQQDMHPPDKTSDKYRIIRGPEQHITDSFLCEKFGDEESIQIRGELMALEITILECIKPRTDFKEVLEVLQSIRSTVERKVNELDAATEGAATEGPQVLVPHASQVNTTNSFRIVPIKVRQACAVAMARGEQARHQNGRTSSVTDAEGMKRSCAPSSTQAKTPLEESEKEKRVEGTKGSCAPTSTQANTPLKESEQENRVEGTKGSCAHSSVQGNRLLEDPQVVSPQWNTTNSLGMVPMEVQQALAAAMDRGNQDTGAISSVPLQEARLESPEQAFHQKTSVSSINEAQKRAEGMKRSCDTTSTLAKRPFNPAGDP